MPDVSVRSVEAKVEVDVAADARSGARSSLTMAATTFTASCERGEAGNPRRPYQAFVRVVSLPWEVIPETTQVTGAGDRFRLEVRRARKADVGERVVRETEGARSGRPAATHKVAT